MRPLHMLFGIRKAALVLAFSSLVSSGATIYDSGVAALSAADPTQLGRISRDGVTSDWSSPKPFPGIINPTTVYAYHTFSVADPHFQFVQITFDSVSTDTFASAYLNSYNPTNPSQNYLGDPGFSGNSFGTDPLVFQVVVPLNSNVVVLVNETVSVAGLGDPFHIIVEGFTDSNFDDTITPEPTSAALGAIGMGVALLLCYRRRGRNDSRLA
jgi:hypothetical protein